MQLIMITDYASPFINLNHKKQLNWKTLGYKNSLSKTAVVDSMYHSQGHATHCQQHKSVWAATAKRTGKLGLL